MYHFNASLSMSQQSLLSTSVERSIINSEPPSSISSSSNIDTRFTETSESPGAISSLILSDTRIRKNTQPFVIAQHNNRSRHHDASQSTTNVTPLQNTPEQQKRCIYHQEKQHSLQQQLQRKHIGSSYPSYKDIDVHECHNNNNNNNNNKDIYGEDEGCCESSLSMNCQCRRSPIVLSLLILIVVCLFFNVSLIIQVNNHRHAIIVPSYTSSALSNYLSTDLIVPLTEKQGVDEEYDDESEDLSPIKQTLLNSNRQNEELALKQHKLLSLIASNTDGINTNLVQQPQQPFLLGMSHQKSNDWRVNPFLKRTNRLSSYTDVKKVQQRRPEVKPRVKPTATSLLLNAAFSACLLVKDDNDILNEWIAYHYHTINLRSLIVAIDPLSKQSPSSLLEKWRTITRQLTTTNTTSGSKSEIVSPELQIIEWHDEDYMPHVFLRTGRSPIVLKPEDLSKVSDINDPTLQEDSVLQIISNHRYRQRVFLAQCIRTFKDEGKSWVVHIDTDEYIVPSKLVRELKPPYMNIASTLEEAGSVLHSLQQTVIHTPKLVGYPCMSMLRILFGPEEDNSSVPQAVVPTSFNPKSFETIRWTHHSSPNNTTLNGNPKVILDVSAIPEEYIPKDLVFSIHRPVKEMCSRNTDVIFTNYRRQPIVANHYLGSWERYTSRQDNRRSRSVYDRKAKAIAVDGDVDTYAQTWLVGFIEAIGDLSVASKLLGEQYLHQSSISNH